MLYMIIYSLYTTMNVITPILFMYDYTFFIYYYGYNYTYVIIYV